MVENQPGPAGYTKMDGGMAGDAGDSSSDEAMVAPDSSFGSLAATSSGATRLAPLLLTVHSVPTVANQTEIISRLPSEV